jgi:hypothetical protein
MRLQKLTSPTLLLQWFLAAAKSKLSTTAPNDANLYVSWKEGAVLFQPIGTRH